MTESACRKIIEKIIGDAKKAGMLSDEASLAVVPTPRRSVPERDRAPEAGDAALSLTLFTALVCDVNLNSIFNPRHRRKYQVRV